MKTYWHQLSQFYIKWKSQRMEPLLIKKIYTIRVSHIGFLIELTLANSSTDLLQKNTI